MGDIRSKEWVRDQLTRGGVTKLARSAGVSRQTAYTWIARHGLKAGGTAKPRPSDTDLLTLYRSYGSAAAVADRVGVSEDTARRWIIEAGGQMRPRGRRKARIDAEVLLRRRAEGATLSKLAGDYEVSRETIRRRLTTADRSHAGAEGHRGQVAQAMNTTDTSRTRPADETRHRSRKGLRTRRRLVDAARLVFERDGFLDARIADIATAAGVSYGAFYHYFSSKGQIFREVAEAQEVSLLTMSRRADADPFERIRMANRDYLSAYVRAGRIMQVIEEVSRYDAEVQAARVEREDEFAIRLHRSIVRLQENGQADRRIDPGCAAVALGCMVARFAELLIHRGGFDPDHAADQLSLLWANAIGLADSPDP